MAMITLYKWFKNLFGPKRSSSVVLPTCFAQLAGGLLQTCGQGTAALGFTFHGNDFRCIILLSNVLLEKKYWISYRFGEGVYVLRGLQPGNHPREARADRVAVIDV